MWDRAQVWQEIAQTELSQYLDHRRAVRIGDPSQGQVLGSAALRSNWNRALAYAEVVHGDRKRASLSVPAGLAVVIEPVEVQIEVWRL